MSTGRTVLPVPVEVLDRLVDGRHHDPHAVLGPHLHEGAVTVRALRPLASAVAVIAKDGTGHETRTVLGHEHRGVFTGVLDLAQVPDYRLEVRYGDAVLADDDPYRFLPTLGEVDLHLIGEGRHELLWTVLGAHRHHFPSLHGDVAGTAFAVWAPRALGVRLVGDVNRWDGTAHPMRSLGASGVWELFVPGLPDGSRYKFEVLGQDGTWRLKADPLAQRAEHPPATASIVFTSGYEWGDDEWMAQRAEQDPHRGPMSIYEVHLGSWRPGLSYRQLAEELVDYVVQLGFTHVELMPVMEHPYVPSWGYQVTSYFAPTSRFGDPDQFRFLVDRLHRAGIGVILDWVPAHFPKDAWALARFDGTPLYEYADPLRGEHADWGTYVFDYGRPEVRNFLVANAVFWMQEFHADGLRVDAVASMLYLDYSRGPGQWAPNQYGGRENLEAVSFLQEVNATCYRRSRGIVTIAEESTAWPGVTRPTHLGGLGFGLKWNMGWMHDSLDYIAHEPVHRQYHHDKMTFALMYAWTEQFCLPISHDEVVHGKRSLIAKMPGDHWQQLANVRAYLAAMWAHPGKKLLFMGCELGQYAEWSEDRGLDWWLLDHADHRGLAQCLTDLNAVYRATPAMWTQDSAPEGFSWIDANDSAGNVLSWLRWGSDGSVMACIVNFSGVPHEGYRVGLPTAGRWLELVNTDALVYGGSGVGNLGEVVSEPLPWHGRPASATVTLPPLGALWLRPA
jgi:1,4-alpha-glucan branching enzyme